MFILWFVAMLVLDSQGKSRILGFIALSIAVCFELYSHILRYLGTSDTGGLKLLMLLPFVLVALRKHEEASPEVAYGSGACEPKTRTS